MVYDPGCIEAVTSFLQEATPYFTPITTLTSDYRVISLYKQCLDNVLQVIFRLVVQEESDSAWIEPEHLAKLLYPNFIITIPMVFDILMAYGRTNAQLLQRLLPLIFSIEPQYRSDLADAMNYLKSSFHEVQLKVEENGDKTDFDDLAAYTLDCSATIAILLEVYQDAVNVALEIQLEQSITNFYDLTPPLLYKHICAIDRASSSLKLLNQSRIELLGSFRSMTNSHLEKILSNP